MKKNKKKDDVVEVCKTAFKNGRQSGKSLTNAEVIKKVVDDIDDVVEKDDEIEDRNPDSETDDEKMQSIDTLPSETPADNEDEAIQVFRDVMAMSDEDRNMDEGGKLAPLRLSPPPAPSWTDNPTNIKFKVGDIVRYKGFPGSVIYKVVGQAKNDNTYSIKASKARDFFDEHGDKLVKVTDKNAEWIDYWKLNPVIPAPKPWKKK